jgi:TPR repeat protein
MTLRLIGTFTILISTVLAVTLATAQVQTITATHTYVMGDSDSKEQARALCSMTAKRKVLDKAGVLIESFGEVKNFQLTKDQINSYSAAIVSVEIVKEEFGFANGVNTLTLTVKAKIDMADVKKRLAGIVADKGLQAKVDAQQQQIQKIEQQLQMLNQKLGTASASAQEEIRKDRDAELVAYYRLDADRGEAEAQFNLGSAYELGKGVPKDYEQAVAWYREAAEQGDAEAQDRLGQMYEAGKGVRRDYVQAVTWYRKAAEQGHAMAQYNLGFMYARERGVHGDFVQAYMWVTLATSKTSVGYVPDTAEALSILEKNMSSVQLDEARRLAREWTEAFEKQQHIKVVRQETAQKTARETLSKLHPDWREIVGLTEDGKKIQTPYRQWLAKQSAEYQALINESWDPLIVGQSINKFKSETAPKPKFGRGNK